MAPSSAGSHRLGSHRAKSYYRGSFEHVRIGIAITALDGRIIKANRAFAAMLGYDASAIETRHVIDVTHEEDQAQSGERLHRMLAESRNSCRFEKRYTHRDGHAIWADVSADLVRDPSGVPLYYVTSIVDITERKRAEVLALERKELLEATMALSRTGGWSVNLADGSAIRTREQARIFGYDSPEGPWSIDLFLSHIVPEDRREVAERIRRAIAEGVGWELECRIRRADGALRWIWVAARHQPRADGQPACTTGVVQDITERKRIEDDKARLEMQILHAQRLESVGRLAGGIAHDFNNMLGVVLGNVELAETRSEKSQSVRRELTEIRRAAERSAELIARMLAFARQQEIEPRVIDLNVAIEDTLKMLRRLLGEGIRLHWQPAPGLWPVRMDPSQLDRILVNLCVNARDAITGNGDITVSAQNGGGNLHEPLHRQSLLPGDCVTVTVRDSGCGMDSQTLERIFDPFFTTKKPGDGTGLGLAMVYGAVKQNDGYIEVASEVDHGTTFRIHLPRCAKPLEAVASPNDEACPTGSETILLVEDDSAMLAAVARRLESLGYNVIGVSSPSAALAIAEQAGVSFELLVTDVIMPEMNGRELAERLSAIERRPRRLYISGYVANVELENDAAFLHKPFSKLELANAVRAALDAQGGT